MTRKPKTCSCGHPVHIKIAYFESPTKISHGPYMCKCCIAVDRYIRSSVKPPSQAQIEQFRLESSLKLHCFPYEHLNVNIM